VRDGVRVMGAALAITTLLAFLLIEAGRLYLALLLLSALLVVTVTTVAAVGTLIQSLPWARATGVNLLALVPGGAARFLVVAHRDSKSQPVPLVLRIAAAVAALFAWLLLTAGALGMLAEATLPVARVAAGLGIAGGLLLASCGVANASAGALDNATGVTALLDIAARERAAADVALLVTDGEEFGLAGARAAAAARVAWNGKEKSDVVAATLRSVEAAINLDGLDDVGAFVLLEHRLPGLRRRSPLHGALRDAVRSDGETLKARPIPPGLLVDHLPLLRAGLSAITVMRGGIRSLARVHRPADRADRLTGEGAARTARAVSGAIARLRDRSPVAAARSGVARSAPTA